MQNEANAKIVKNHNYAKTITANHLRCIKFANLPIKLVHTKVLPHVLKSKYMLGNFKHTASYLQCCNYKTTNFFGLRRKS